MKFEYVASGCSFIRIIYKDVLDHIDLVNKYFSSVNNNNGHYFSLLFNAYTEANYGKFFENYKPSIYKVHADSGGLQLVTRGTQAAKDKKKDIYKVQAKYAHIGMSFDEIPVILPKKKSKRGDLSGRFFDRDNLKEFAKISGENLLDQIRTFQEEKTQCQPYLIVHGNDVPTALEWTETMLDQIPEDMRSYIGGIAMGGGSFGNGTKEALLRAFLAGQILKDRTDLPNKKIHFLGLGSLKNAFPFVAMTHSGHYSPDWTISYDSTTHTSGHHLGNYLDSNGKRVTMGRDFTNVYSKIHKDVTNTLDVFKDRNLPVKDFYKILNSPVREYVDNEGDFGDVLHTNLGISLAQISSFTKKIEEYSTDFNTFLKDNVQQNEWNQYRQVLKINSLDSYNYWDSNMGSYLESKKTPERSTMVSLDGFFE